MVAAKGSTTDREMETVKEINRENKQEYSGNERRKLEIEAGEGASRSGADRVGTAAQKIQLVGTETEVALN